jgi:hypothetical protein
MADSFLANELASFGAVSASVDLGADNRLVRSDGTAKAVQGSTNAYLDDSDRLLLGTNTALTHTSGGALPQIQIHGTDDGTSSLVAARYGANANGPNYRFMKSRATAVGSRAVVQQNDLLGRHYFYGDDGTNFVPGAEIRADVDGTPGTNDMPSRLSLLTAPDGSIVPQIRLVVDNAGLVRPGADNAQSFGSASFRWSAIYSANGTIQTSDERDKEIVGDLSFAGRMIDAVDPIMFKWIVGGNRLVKSETETTVDDEGNEVPAIVLEPVPGSRLHAGFSAQHLHEAMRAVGQDFGAWGLDDKDNPDSRQWVRPDQLIPVLWAALKETRAQLAALKKAGAKQRKKAAS